MLFGKEPISVPVELFDYLLTGCARSHAEDLLRNFRQDHVTYARSSSIAPDPGAEFGRVLDRLRKPGLGYAVLFLDHYLDYLHEHGHPHGNGVHAEALLRGLVMAWPDDVDLGECRKIVARYNQEGKYRPQSSQ